jgi:putative thioredoxin
MTNNLIFDATPENFNELVLGNSARGPVMVNYWSEKAGPCIKLWPTLEALVNEYGGRFLLVNVNTDKYKSFAQNELGIVSVPTLQIFHNHQVVDVMHGAESEGSIRHLLSRHLPRASDSLLLDSVKMYNANKPDQAIDELKKLQQSDPENSRIATSIIKLLYRESRFQDMEKYINTQSATVKNNEEVISLLTHSMLHRAASQVKSIEHLNKAIRADAKNMDLIYQLVAMDALNDHVTDALDQLLNMLKIDASYRNNLPARTMVLLLKSLGADSTEAKIYRAKMIDTLSV